MPAHLEERGKDTIAVQGELNPASVAALWEDTQRRFRTRLPKYIDLAGVNRSDSAGVALLVEWLRQAKARRQELQFINIPSQMLTIIRVTDLDDLLPLA